MILHVCKPETQADSHIYWEGLFRMDKIVEMKPMRFAGIPVRGDYWGLPAAWQKLIPLVHHKGLFKPGTQAMSLFMSHNQNVPMEDRLSYAAITVGEDYQASDGLEIIDVPGGLYAVTVHLGHPDGIGDTWDQWRNNGFSQPGYKYQEGRISFEWYQNNPQFVPEELQVALLCDPVQKINEGDMDVKNLRVCP